MTQREENPLYATEFSTIAFPTLPNFLRREVGTGLPGVSQVKSMPWTEAVVSQRIIEQRWSLPSGNITCKNKTSRCYSSYFEVRLGCELLPLLWIRSWRYSVCFCCMFTEDVTLEKEKGFLCVPSRQLGQTRCVRADRASRRREKSPRLEKKHPAKKCKRLLLFSGISTPQKRPGLSDFRWL